MFKVHTLTMRPPIECVTNTTGRCPTPAWMSLSSTARAFSGTDAFSPSHPATGACVRRGGGGGGRWVEVSRGRRLGGGG
jgi:hypothetical protein